MGGNALRLCGFEAMRISAIQYEDYYADIKQLLIGNGVFSELHRVEAYRQKKEHGDIDFKGLLCGGENGKWKEIVKNISGCKASHTNGQTLSVEFKGVQVDIEAFRDEPKMRAALDYSHYSPLGNILGRMLKQIGLKWGVDGLSKPLTEGTHVFGGILLSNSIKPALELAGMNHDEWRAGFEAQEDIFEYAAGSWLFNKEIFKLENLNHVNRKRNIKRPDYNAWLNFSLEMPDKRAEGSCNTGQPAYIEFKQRLAEMFPKLEAQEVELRNKEKLRGDSKKLLNGEVIQRITGLHGKCIGEVMEGLIKLKGGRDKLFEWALIASVKEREKTLMECARELKARNQCI